MKKYKIYSLNDPVNNEVRYIGYTSQSLKERLRCHIKDVNTKSVNSYKNKWIRSLLKQELIPLIFLIVDVDSKDEVINLEITLIKEYKDNGFRLTNNTLGGEGGAGYVFSKEKKLEMSKNRIGKKTKSCSDERKMKISKANKGRKLTPEQKVKISLRVKERWNNNDKAKELLGDRNRGKKLPIETRLKMAEAIRNQWKNGIRKGHPATENQKKIMSEKMRSSQRNEKGCFVKKNI